MIKLERAQLSDGGIHIIVKGQIDVFPIRMVLDTGASHSVLDLNWVKNNLSHSEIEAIDDPAHGIGATLEVSKVDLPKISIGDLEILDHKVALIDFSTINTVYSREGFDEVQGILGGDILAEYKAIIDYGSMELHFKKSV